MTTKKARKTNRLRINQEELKNGESFQIGDFVVNNEGLFLKKFDKETGEETVFKVCEPLFVKQTVQNLDTKDVHLDFCYKLKGTYQEIKIGMGQLVPNELIKLMSKGVDIPHEFVKVIATYLREQQKLAPHKVLFHQVGWHRDDQKQLVFRHNRMISAHSDIRARNDNEQGSYNLEPKGDLVAWVEMIKKEVVGHAPLETVLAFGFSSAIIGYLSHLYDDVDTMIAHLAGNSTQGKTTAALLGVSIFGMPSHKKKGLGKSWNGTTNSLINMLGGNFGIPIVLDELSMSNAASLTSVLYILASGQEKARLTDTIQQRKQGMWALAILSTGELSIFERTNHNVGLTVRTFEFSNITWTKSAENADAIRKVIQDNYGHAGETFVQYLFDQGLDTIDETWKVWQKRCSDALPDTPFRTRIAKKYAIIMAAADLANHSLGINLSLDNILTFLVKQEEVISKQRDIGKKAWQLIIQLIIKHQANFRKEGIYFNPIQCWGKMFPQGSYTEVAFLKHILEQQLKELGFDDPKVVLRDWKEKKWLLTESDRPTKRTRIFEENEQKQRQEALGMANQKLPKKLEDTTYNLKIPKEQLAGLVQGGRFPNAASLDEDDE
jgi:putative DNA primase/helicase